MKKRKEEITKAYSIRNMPLKLRDRLKDQAEYETRLNREEGKGVKSMEALFIELVAEGLGKREAERKK